MKKILTLVCVVALAATQLFAVCDNHKVKGNGKVETKDRALSSFEKINLGGNIDIVIDQNGKESASVETDENIQELIITEVKEGELNIRVKENYSVHPTKLVIRVSCSKLAGINSGGSGDVKCASKITGDNFTVSHGGSGDFELILGVKKLKINTAGSGDYALKGTADEFTLSMAGSGDVNAKELACISANVSTVGSGDVFLKKGVTAKVSSVGSGDVVYQ